ncbi:MAG: DUF1552 domain-containing protein, partial [Myxococcota bacterium]
MIRTIPRRSFLRGAGRVALALPALEIMAPSASAGEAAIPKRFVMSFGGTSLGRGNWPEVTTPEQEGPDYDPGIAFASLVDSDVKDDVTVVSGLEIPWQDGGAIPPAGRAVQFHFNTTVPQIAGTRATEPFAPPTGPTADHLAAATLGAGAAMDVLACRVQVQAYWGGSGSGGNMRFLSWRPDGQGGVQAFEPAVSPKTAYDDMVQLFEPDDPAEAEAFAKARARTLSVLDLVSQSSDALLPRLGHRDRIRMEQHFDEIRALETKLAAEPPPTSGACQIPEPFGPDPEGNDHSFDEDGNYIPNGGYNGEEERADHWSDLIRLAFACDLTRSASYMLTMWKCYMNALPVLGLDGDFHGLTHGTYGNNSNTYGAAGFGWHVEKFAQLVAKLKATPEVDGSTLLDHTALVLVFEGGHGFDPA